MEKTTRFYRDLLGMKFTHGIGIHGYRHCLFRTGGSYVAFFEYDEARPMHRKVHGAPTSKPLGFDHVSFAVDSKEELFNFKDKLEAADIDVTGAVDHGSFWSIYFFDPNNIPLEVSWDTMEITETLAMDEQEPISLVSEGANAQPGIWPNITNPTMDGEMTAYPGNGYTMRNLFVHKGLGRLRENFVEKQVKSLSQ